MNNKLKFISILLTSLCFAINSFGMEVALDLFATASTAVADTVLPAKTEQPQVIIEDEDTDAEEDSSSSESEEDERAAAGNEQPAQDPIAQQNPAADQDTNSTDNPGHSEPSTTSKVFTKKNAGYAALGTLISAGLIWGALKAKNYFYAPDIADNDATNLLNSEEEESEIEDEGSEREGTIDAEIAGIDLGGNDASDESATEDEAENETDTEFYAKLKKAEDAEEVFAILRLALPQVQGEMILAVQINYFKSSTELQQACTNVLKTINVKKEQRKWLKATERLLELQKTT